jgi:site-specific DNA-methyltransferase (adenine-specific)
VTINHLGALKPDKNNARRHGERNISMISRSLETDGFGRSILLDAAGNIIAGNGVTEAAGNVGIEDVLIVPSDGTRVIAIQRTDVAPGSERAVRLAIADNRANELSDFDPAVVAALANEVDLSDFWRDDELAELLASIETDTVPVGDDPGAQMDRAGELQAKWHVERGQLYEIGRHRLLCGDSTDAGDVSRLMGDERAKLVYTDPPYGVDYDGGTKEREKLAGDHDAGIYALFLPLLRDATDERAPLYLWYADPVSVPVLAAFVSCGFECRAVIVWNKNIAQFGALSAQYKQKHEPCWYAHRKGQAPYWYGPTNEVTVWDEDRTQVNEHHPTQKPPALAERAIRNSSAEGDIVLDCFLGGGSTMVAAEQTSRRCYGIEIEPKYCAVILERMSGMGLTPRLVARDGTTD